jgi:hypothetical protein
MALQSAKLLIEEYGLNSQFDARGAVAERAVGTGCAQNYLLF